MFIWGGFYYVRIVVPVHELEVKVGTEASSRQMNALGAIEVYYGTERAGARLVRVSKRLIRRILSLVFVDEQHARVVAHAHLVEEHSRDAFVLNTCWDFRKVKVFLEDKKSH